MFADLAKRLTEDPEFREAHAIVSDLSKSGKIADLVALWRAIDAHAAKGEAPIDRCEVACDIVVEYLALTPGQERVEALLELLSHEGASRLYQTRSRDLVVRGFASRLGYAQPKEALLALLERDAPGDTRRELLACWMHEVVLCGTALDREPVARRFQEKLVATNHPLGAFPLHLLDAEREAPTYMPMYGAEAIQRAVSSLESGEALSTRTVPPPADPEAPRATPVEDPALERKLREAVNPWMEASKGKCEARVFSLTPAASASAGRWLLRGLPIASTQGKGLELAGAPADAVWGALFAAAANGGAYSTGLGGAYGRKAAWTSFAALVGADAAPSEVDRVAANTHFLMFGGTDFFFDVAWDLGVAAIRPGGGSVAVLAATDTD